MADKRFNGERLKSARVYRGLSVADLAEKMDLQRQTISLYESCKIDTPDFEHIRKMGEILDFPIDFFLQQDKDSLVMGSTYFRSLLTTNKKYRSEQIERVKLIGKMFSFLSEYLEFLPLELPQYSGNDPEDAAKLLRRVWGLSDKPIEDLINLVEMKGIIVTSFLSESDCVDAFSQYIRISGNKRFIIGYSNNKSSASRVHFDIAHELGHMLLHGWSEDVEDLSKDDFRDIELQAHSFAGAFLLPEDSFLHDLGVYGNNLDYYVELKKKWKVSIAAMIRRASNLGAITQFTYQQLMRSMQKKGIRKVEPLDEYLVTAEPTMFRTAIDILLEKGVFTPKEFVETLATEGDLSLTSKEIEKLLGLPDGQLDYEALDLRSKLDLRLLKPNRIG